MSLYDRAAPGHNNDYIYFLVTRVKNTLAALSVIEKTHVRTPDYQIRKTHVRTPD